MGLLLVAAKDAGVVADLSGASGRGVAFSFSMAIIVSARDLSARGEDGGEGAQFGAGFEAAPVEVF